MKLKSILTFTWICLIFVSCSNDDVDTVVQARCDFIGYKYYNGNQDALGTMSSDYILIGIDRNVTNAAIQSFIAGNSIFDPNYIYTIHDSGAYPFKEIPLKLNGSKTCEEITQIIATINQNSIVAYTHFTMQTNDCNNLIWQPIGNLCVNSYSSSFFVKVNDPTNLNDLNQMIAQTSTMLVSQNQFMPEWFELQATKSANGDAVAMANVFATSGLFLASEPSVTKYPVE